MEWEGLLDIDPSTEVIWHKELLELSFSFERVAVKVTTGHEHEFRLKDALFAEE